DRGGGASPPRPLREGLGRGRIATKPGTALPLKTQCYAAFWGPPPVTVLRAAGDRRDSPLLAETYFLEMALRLAPPGESYADSPFRPTSLALGEGDRLGGLSGQRIVVLANVGTVSRSDAAALARCVEGGGNLVAFP